MSLLPLASCVVAVFVDGVPCVTDATSTGSCCCSLPFGAAQLYNSLRCIYARYRVYTYLYMYIYIDKLEAATKLQVPDLMPYVNCKKKKKKKKTLIMKLFNAINNS